MTTLAANRLTVRLATAEDVAEVYPRLPPSHTLKARVIERTGQILGIGGVFYAPGQIGATLFWDVRPEMLKHPLFAFRALRAFLREHDGSGVFATSDRETPGRAGLLYALGFRFVCTGTAGDLFRYEPRGRTAA